MDEGKMEGVKGGIEVEGKEGEWQGMIEEGVAWRTDRSQE
jgi:hypothetical protein